MEEVDLKKLYQATKYKRAYQRASTYMVIALLASMAWLAFSFYQVITLRKESARLDEEIKAKKQEKEELTKQFEASQQKLVTIEPILESFQSEYVNDNNIPTPTPTPTLTPKPTPTPRPPVNIDISWLSGIWEGTAYQITSGSTWQLRLSVQKDKYLIDYPSLSCSGEWTLLKKSTETIGFQETITSGRCVDKGFVIIERKGPSQILFNYINPSGNKITSSAILNRK